jgi:type I restriction enzyme S subunit
MATDKQHTTLNVPTLRFPEFSGEWEKTNLGSLITMYSGGTPSIDITEYWDGNIPFISATSMHDTYIYDSQLHLSKKGLLKGSKLLPSWNLLLLVRGSMLWNRIPICINTVDVAFNQDVKGIIATGISTFFLLNWFQSKENRIKYLVSGTGIGAGKLDTADVASLTVSYPDCNEQQKVATLFRIIDERIATQRKVIEKLQSLIGGIIHRVSCDGLKNGTWRMKMLSSVLSERIELNTEQYQVHSVSVTQGVINQVEYLGRSFAAKDTSNYHVVKYGDIVYTKSPTGDFPYGIIKQSYINDNVAVSPLYGVYKPNSIALGMILHHYFLSPVNAQNYLHKLIQKGAKNTINITNQRFLENSIPLPMKSIDIEKLATLLQLYDAKLTMENNLLSALHRQKMYLLSTMFI